MSYPLSMHPSHPESEVAAARWAERLARGALLRYEQEELLQWLAADDAHIRQLEDFRRVLGGLEQVVPQLVREGTLVEDTLSFYRPRLRILPQVKRWSGALAASIAIMAAAIWWQNRPEEVSTGAATRQTLALMDGSQVDLNARTRLAWRIRDGERSVRLDEGEAFFAVTKDRERPFVIATSAGEVRVVGTAFNVRVAGLNQIEVTVLEGAVDVVPSATGAGSGVASGTALRLQPGDQLKVGAEHFERRKLSLAAARDATAWRDGRMIFESEGLATAVARFGRYHGIDIAVDADIAAMEIGGRFRLDDLDNFLRGVEVALPVQVLRGGERRIRITSR